MLAEGVGLLAEIAFDLEETLLEGGGAEKARTRAAEHPLSGKAQRGVILSGGPGKVALFCHLSQWVVGADDGAHSEPGQDDVDRKVGDPLRAEERLRTGETAGVEVPVPGPEWIGLALEHPHQFRGFADRWEIGGKPGFEALGQIARDQPLRGQGESALRMVRGPEPVEPPDPLRQCDGIVGLLFPPPEIPGASGVIVDRGAGPCQFGGKEAAHAEQPGVELKPIRDLGGIEQLRQEFGEAAHGPDVVFVAERGEEGLLEGLIPSDLAGAGGEFLALALEADLGGLTEELAQAGIGPIAEERLTAATHGVGQKGLDPEPMTQLVEWRVELPLEHQGGQ